VKKAEQIEVRWPNGIVEKVGSIEADQFVTIQEGRGIVKAGQFR
jgi:hypothetical protein